ncbi:hypothetical protein [Ruegeria lacuscaerulensis]|uniref:hypothetical protein n=1 Tax=Ruegeria lacuscaerulensis TaxID=55218 RepID=UPI00147FFED6|nr:hypothetical protein [Ruegeria lacuscaerulensis]
MLRSALNFVSLCLFGFTLLTASLMLAFFASPEAVRTQPPALYDSLLLELLSNR